MAVRPGGAITGRIVLLVAACVLLAALVNFAITFNGPPPKPAPYRTEDLAIALAGGRVPGPGQPPRIMRSATPPAPRDGEFRNPALEAELARRLNQPADTVRAWARHGGRRDLRGSFTVAIRDGPGWRVATTRPEPWLSRWHLVTIGAMTATLILLTLIGWVVARAITRPLARLAEAADAVSVNHHGAPADISGPPEIARVAHALNAMRARLVDHVAQRTTMLAAITHDLGTPLTRLAFRIERLPPADRARAIADIEEMRAMIQSVLEFARGESRPHRALDLAPLLDGLADDMAITGARIERQVAAPLPMMGDPAALRRLFSNLVDNALRYGGNARIDATTGNGRICVTVDDDGPGIPAALAASLFDPFVRAEPSRSRETGGIGLGLSIARNIAEAHDGQIVAGNRDGGGARFTVSLPLAG
ncbi:HAMP domain-containing sensor histidine kinase [Sphingomonas colocasiae]|uniref:histidine kinase n=1 Tax=Sphingomonas colocasiae TaxID=1848973 RepID=A0ABS7PZ00_9SPHN|nr:HAMP domain-containing sensor histidine kinase [Sphingomonas colocasiae]MBY8825870.1 HAMP domain-containing histidine kinase [Sphingomonas colocasiae]